MCTILERLVTAPSNKKTCAHMLIEISGLAVELDLSTVGIINLQDYVPLPLFISELKDGRTKTEDDIYVECHFLAQVTLRTLIDRFRTSKQIFGMYFSCLSINVL